MKYTYYANVPIGKEALDTTCLVRHSKGSFEEFRDGRWVDAPRFFSILIGEADDFEEVTSETAQKILRKLSGENDP